MVFYREEKIFDIEDKWRQKIIQGAHRDAFHFLSSKLEGFMDGTADKSTAYRSYRSSFMDSLIRHYNSHSEPVRRTFHVTFLPLLERLAEKGATEYMVETDPLTLTVFLNNNSMSFTDSEQGLFVGVNDHKVRVSHWSADMVDLLEIVIDECQETDTIKRIDRLLVDYKTEELKNKILVATVNALIQEKLQEGTYKVKTNCITYYNEVFLYMETIWGYISLTSPFEEFEENFDREIEKIQASPQK